LEPKIGKKQSLQDYLTPERCFILENFSSERISVARARVQPGISTASHHLEGVDEIYVVTEGKGRVAVGNLKPTDIESGNVVVIPAGTSQKITNIGEADLIFYYVCTPKFTAECYRSETAEKPLL
jgi:mannose-6-phosphate isomerase-like protein (cupin superfamily)